MVGGVSEGRARCPSGGHDARVAGWRLMQDLRCGWDKGAYHVRKCVAAGISVCLVIPFDRPPGSAYSYRGIHSGDGGQWTVGGNTADQAGTVDPARGAG